MKKRILLLLTSLTTITSCGFFNNEEPKPTTTTDDPPKNDTTKEETSNEPKEELEVVEKETDESYTSEMGVEDTTKNEFTVKWISDGKTIETQNNVSKGAYAKINDENKIPTKTSIEQDYIYTFKGWSRNPDSTTGLEEKDLFPIVSDTTFYSVFEKERAYEADIYYIKSRLDLLSPNKYIHVGTRIVPEGDIFDVESITPEPDAYKNIYLARILELDDNLSFFDINGDAYKTYEDLDEFKQNGGIKKNTKYLVEYDHSDISYSIKFMNEGVLFNGYGNLSYGDNYYESYYVDFMKNMGKPAPYSIYSQPDPIKISDGKKYKFLGWRKDGDNTSTPFSSIEIPSCTGEDVVYNAVYSNETTPVFMTMRKKSTKDVEAYTLDEAKNKKYFKVENNVLKPYLEGGAFGNLRGNYDEIRFTITDSSIKSLSADVFSTLKVSSVQFGSNITSLPSKILYDMETLTDVKISSSLTSIPNDAFYGCKELSKFDGFEYIKSFGERSFSGCNNLNVNFGSQINSIGKEAFYNANMNENLSLNVKTIGEGAFSNAKNLNKVTLLNTTNVGKRAFAYTSVEEINLPKTLTQLDYDTDSSDRISGKPFEACKNLNKVTIDSGNTKYASHNSNGIFTKDGKTLIQGSKSVVIPNSTTTIEEKAFSRLTLEKVYIPKNVTLLRRGAIEDNENLSYIDFQGTTEDFKKLCERSVDYVFHGNIRNNVNVRCSNGEILLELK